MRTAKLQGLDASGFRGSDDLTRWGARIVTGREQIWEVVLSRGGTAREANRAAREAERRVEDMVLARPDDPDGLERFLWALAVRYERWRGLQS
jgi:hypothetical protein